MNKTTENTLNNTLDNSQTFREKYDSLIAFRRSTPPPNGAYIEHHHIVPRSIDPSRIKDESNIVPLTGAEHFLAHYYLIRIYRDEEPNSANYRKMLFSFMMMKKCLLKSCELNTMQLTALSEIYNMVRNEYSKQKSKDAKKRWKKKGERKKQAKLMRSIMTGVPKTEEQKEKMSLAKKGIAKSESHKQHISKGVAKWWQERKLQEVVCG